MNLIMTPIVSPAISEQLAEQTRNILKDFRYTNVTKVPKDVSIPVIVDPEIEVIPENYILHNNVPTQFFGPITTPVLERKPIIYDRIEDPNKPKTYYASVDKMSFGGQINTETGFLDDLTMPIATGNHAERIMNRIDRRANRAVNRIENGRMNVRRGDRLGNQHARDLGRLNEINSVRGDLHLPESRRNAREAVLNYLNSVGMNEVERLPKYPGHY